MLVCVFGGTLMCLCLQLLQAVAVLSESRDTAPALQELSCPDVCLFAPRYGLYRSWCSLCPFYFPFLYCLPGSPLWSNLPTLFATCLALRHCASIALSSIGLCNLHVDTSFRTPAWYLFYPSNCGVSIMGNGPLSRIS